MKRKLIASVLALSMAFSIGGALAGCSEDPVNGKSAYELWLEDGNTGEMDDFFAWLKGEQGIQGETGATGVGISGIAFNEEGKLVITMTDGTEYVLEVPNNNYCDECTNVEEIIYG